MKNQISSLFVFVAVISLMTGASCDNSIDSPYNELTQTNTTTQKAISNVSVDYVVQDDWGSGFVANVTISNNSGSAIDGWILTWTFPNDQQITNAWNADVSQSGNSVTAEGVDWNSTIPDGGSVGFGFQGTYSGSNDNPSDFAINGESSDDDPVAVFSIDPSNPQPGESVTVDASDSYDPNGTITAYSWNFGDGGSATGITSTHTYSTEGDYQVTLTVTDNDGNTTSVAKTVVVSTDDPAGTPGQAQIILSNNSISISGSGATVNGNQVTISSAGQYTVTGTISDGQIIVETSDEGDVEIILTNVNITCLDSAPINIRNGDVILTLTGDNTVTDGNSYIYDDVEEEEPNGTVFSKDDLTITGTGSLTINANFNDGVNCNDDLEISGGTLNVTAVDDGLVGNDSLEINGGLINISASSQGLKSDEVTVNGGNIDVSICKEGIEAEMINIAGGVLRIYASDDALNATMGERTEMDDGSQIVVSGGVLYLSASAGDAVDSNGAFTMTGGTIGACGPTSGANVAIDVNSTTTVSGGLFIATSSNSWMNEYPNGQSTQYSFAVMLTYVQSANSIVCVEDASGNDLVKFRAERDFYSIIFSSPDLVFGSTYSLSAGGTVSGGTEENGMIVGGTYSGGTVLETITLDTSPTTVVGDFGGGGGIWPF